MDLRAAQRLAESEMSWYGLDVQGWTFRWNSARSFNGQTHFTTKTIRLSKILTSMREEQNVRMTIIHEIAHALIGPGHGHGELWRRKFVSLGGDGKRCSSDTHNAESIAKYKVMCGGGQQLGFVNRKTKKLVAARCKCHAKPLVFLNNLAGKA